MSCRDDNYHNMIGSNALFDTSEGKLAFENDTLRLRIKYMGINYEKELDLKDNKISSLHERCELLQEEVEKARRKIEKLKQKKASLAKIIKDTRQKIEELQKIHTTDMEEIRSLQTKLQYNISENEKLLEKEQEQGVEKEFIEKEFQLLQTKLSLQDEQMAKRDDEIKKHVTAQAQEMKEYMAKRDEQIKEDINRGIIATLGMLFPKHAKTNNTTAQNTADKNGASNTSTDTIDRNSMFVSGTTTDMPDKPNTSDKSISLRKTDEDANPETRSETFTLNETEKTNTPHNLNLQNVNRVQINFQPTVAKMKSSK